MCNSSNSPVGGLTRLEEYLQHVIVDSNVLLVKGRPSL